MPKFSVSASETILFEVLVNAKNKKEAEEKATALLQGDADYYSNEREGFQIDQVTKL